MRTARLRFTVCMWVDVTGRGISLCGWPFSPACVYKWMINRVRCIRAVVHLIQTTPGQLRLLLTVTVKIGPAAFLWTESVTAVSIFVIIIIIMIIIAVETLGPMNMSACQLFANLGRKVSSASCDEREGAFLFCRQFRCWCNATTLYCYMTRGQPPTARTDGLYQFCIILILKLPRELIYRG